MFILGHAIGYGAISLSLSEISVFMAHGNVDCIVIAQFAIHVKHVFTTSLRYVLLILLIH